MHTQCVELVGGGKAGVFSDAVLGVFFSPWAQCDWFNEGSCMCVVCKIWGFVCLFERPLLFLKHREHVL